MLQHLVAARATPSLRCLWDQVGILYECRPPNVVLMLGAWLGQDQLYRVQEVLSTDLWHALNEPSMVDDLRWENRCAWYMPASQLSAALCSPKQRCNRPARRCQRLLARLSRV